MRAPRRGPEDQERVERNHRPPPPFTSNRTRPKKREAQRNAGITHSPKSSIDRITFAGGTL